MIRPDDRVHEGLRRSDLPTNGRPDDPRLTATRLATMPEKVPLTRCPTHDIPLHTRYSSATILLIRCTIQGCALQMQFVRPVCGQRRCTEQLQVREVFTNGTAWAICPRGCKGMTLHQITAPTAS